MHLLDQAVSRAVAPLAVVLVAEAEGRGRDINVEYTCWTSMYKNKKTPIQAKKM